MSYYKWFEYFFFNIESFLIMEDTIVVIMRDTIVFSQEFLVLMI